MNYAHHNSSTHSGAVHELNSTNHIHDEFPSQPGPVRVIVPYEEEHQFALNTPLLEYILLDPRYADKKVDFA